MTSRSPVFTFTLSRLSTPTTLKVPRPLILTDSSFINLLLIVSNIALINASAFEGSNPYFSVRDGIKSCNVILFILSPSLIYFLLHRRCWFKSQHQFGWNQHALLRSWIHHNSFQLLFNLERTKTLYDNRFTFLKRCTHCIDNCTHHLLGFV